MAKGSHATWSPGDSRICFICGRKIALVHGAWIHYDNETNQHRSTHLECGPPMVRTNAGHEGNTDQARELEAIMRQAFNAGLKSGYRQGIEALRSRHDQPMEHTTRPRNTPQQTP